MPSEDERFETVRMALAWRVNKSELDTAAEALASIKADLAAKDEALRLADAVVGGIATDNGQQVWFVGDHMALRIWDYQRARTALAQSQETER